MIAVPPAVAVVIATYRRAELLPRLVAALGAQHSAPSYEVVIVDDCSPDDTASVLTGLATQAPFPLTVLRQERNAGPAAARNRGWRATTAPLVAFTDDDCVPQPGWLAAIVRALADTDVAQGRTTPDPEQAQMHGPFSRTLNVPAMDGFFQTCNIGYRREWLERLDGFDEDFRFPMAEDTDLAWRALEQGADAVFVEDALVHHDVRESSALVAIKDSARWESVVLIVSKHPEIRTKLHSTWFWKAAHAPALMALAGLLLAMPTGDARRRLAGLALAAPYVKHRLVDSPLPNTSSRRRRLRLLPAALAVDLAEVAVLARASARYKRLVL
jgi:glycosyltransferase involved in cell wall biosynthesis